LQFAARSGRWRCAGCRSRLCLYVVWSLVAVWSSSLVSGGHGQGISKLRFAAVALGWQPVVHVVDGETSISSNKARQGSYTGEFPDASSACWSSASPSAPRWRPGKVGIGRCLNNSGSEVRHHRHLLCLPPLARGRCLGSEGELVSRMRRWSDSAALVCPLAVLFESSSSSKVVIREGDEVAAGELGWYRSSRTITWSISSAIFDGLPKSLALSRPFKPVRISGDVSTSFVRPLVSSVAEGFARTKTSGVVPVDVHGCSVPSSLLCDGEQGGLDCVFPFFSKVLLTNARDPYVIFFFSGILCNNLYLHRC